MLMNSVSGMYVITFELVFQSQSIGTETQSNAMGLLQFDWFRKLKFEEFPQATNNELVKHVTRLTSNAHQMYCINTYIPRNSEGNCNHGFQK